MLQKLLFDKGIDSDTSPEFLGEGMGRYRLNVRVMTSEGGEEQAVEKVKGNVLVNYSLPTGTNRVIGAAEYILNKKNYYFIWNSNNNHLILEYDQVADVVNEVFVDTTNILNFDADHLITGIDVVRLDENNDLLYWTDFFNEPRKINIRKAKLHFQGDYINGYSFPFNPDNLYRIKAPPLCPPSYYWSNDTASSSGSLVVERGNPTYGIIFPLKSTIQKLPLIVEVSDTQNEYNNSTLRYTAATSGNRNISANMDGYDGNVYIASAPPVSGITLLLIKNGSVVVSSNTVYFTYVKINDPILPSNRQWVSNTFIYASLTVSNLLLGAGEYLEVYAIANAFDTSRIYTQTSSLGLTISTPDNLEGKINYLFKKLFVFKAQFVYDDYEKSAWSPHSKFVFPNTITNGGEDIVAQDNLINIYVPTGSSIVKKIRVAAREVASNNFVLITELDKDVLNIPDNSTYLYKFNNQGNYTQLEINESIKLFDYVPRLSKSQSLLPNNRLVDGCIFEGYDPVDINVRLTLNYEWLGNVYSGKQNRKYPVESYFKLGGIYTFGIVYYDHANRSGLTNIVDAPYDTKVSGVNGTVLYVPFMNSIAFTPPASHPKIEYITYPTMSIYHEPPSWATHYQIVVSKNKGMGRYIQFPSDDLEYINLADGSVVSASAADGIRVYIGTLLNYNTVNKLSSLSYGLQTGDKIRFIANSTDVEYSYNEQDVVAQSADYIDVRKGNNTPLNLTATSFVEIFNSTSNATDIFYEIGECYEVVQDSDGNYLHKGNLADQIWQKARITSLTPTIIIFNTYTLPFNGTVGDSIICKLDSGGSLNIVITAITIGPIGAVVQGRYTKIDASAAPATGTDGVISSAAKVVIIGGDTFRIQSRYLLTPIAGNSGATYWVESPNASNFFTSVAADFGRPNRVDDEYKSILRPSTIYYSEQFIPETFINGLSSVFDINFETYSQVYGEIQKLFADEQDLYCFQELKISRIGVNKITYNDLEGGNTVGASVQVLNQQPVYYDGRIGIGRHPESFAIYGHVKYGVDVNRGVVWRLSNDGLTLISEYKQHQFFSKTFKSVMSNASKVNIYGVYDIRFNEYVVAINQFGTNDPQTIAFNEKTNLWSTHYSIYPDYFISNGIDIISFKDGALWKHNASTVYNNFYGTQYSSILEVYCNVAPSNVKLFLAISFEGINPWDAVVETPVTGENPNGQHTELIKGNFQLKEGILYSDILRDDYTPNIVVDPLNPYLPNARFEGRQVRGRYALVRLTDGDANYNKLFATNIQYIASNRSNV